MNSPPSSTSPLDIKPSPRDYAHALYGNYIGLLFEKASLRTRLTFELAIKQLGGDSVFTEGPIGAREPVKDVARNLDRWVHAIVARTFSQYTIEELADWSAVPVINALSDLYHPCQVLADVLTLREHFGELAGLKARLLRRWQQRRPLPHAHLRPPRHRFRHRLPRGL